MLSQIYVKGLENIRKCELNYTVYKMYAFNSDV